MSSGLGLRRVPDVIGPEAVATGGHEHVPARDGVELALHDVEESGTRPTYSSESEIAAPGGGVAADADAPVASCPCQGGEHQHSSPHAGATYMPLVPLGSAVMRSTRDRPQPAPAGRRVPRGRRRQGPQGPGRRSRSTRRRRRCRAGRPRRADLGAQADGQRGPQGRRRQPAAALPLDGVDGQATAVSGTLAVPKGKRAEGRLAADLVGARDDRHRRPVRAVARGQAPLAVRRPLLSAG